MNTCELDRTGKFVEFLCTCLVLSSIPICMGIIAYGSYYLSRSQKFDDYPHETKILSKNINHSTNGKRYYVVISTPSSQIERCQIDRISYRDYSMGDKVVVKMRTYRDQVEFCQGLHGEMTRALHLEAR